MKWPSSPIITTVWHGWICFVFVFTCLHLRDPCFRSSGTYHSRERRALGRAAASSSFSYIGNYIIIYHYVSSFPSCPSSCFSSSSSSSSSSSIFFYLLSSAFASAAVSAMSSVPTVVPFGSCPSAGLWRSSAIDVGRSSSRSRSLDWKTWQAIL